MAPPGVLTDATEETLLTTYNDKITGHVSAWHATRVSVRAQLEGAGLCPTVVVCA